MTNGVFFGRIARDKKGFLHKTVTAGKQRGFDTAHLVDDEGRPVAYAGDDGVKVNDLSP